MIKFTNILIENIRRYAAHAPARYATLHCSEAEASVKADVSSQVRFMMLMKVAHP